uniref:Uncharacterized protein n=1 Tax=Anguilla anguilla TaxID=7936 RepID=A0A0E9UNS1_ANGAN
MRYASMRFARPPLLNTFMPQMDTPSSCSVCLNSRTPWPSPLKFPRAQNRPND